MTKTLRVRTKAGWTTKPEENRPENRLTSEEIDDNFLALETDIENRQKVYDSVADMVADATLTVGRKVRTLGYYTAGDGGGNEFDIVAAGTGTDDGGSFIDLTGISGQAKGLFTSSIISVKQFGATGDNLSDDTSALQNAYNFAARASLQPLGGGRVLHPKGVYRTSSKLEVSSDVALVGEGVTNTYIKPLDSASFSANEAVIMSKDFDTVQGTNLWDYYSPYPNGLVMGLSLEDLCIDGNRGSVATAGGLHIYGGKWSLRNVSVINTSGHGIWTEAGLPGSSTSGDDLHDYLNMHESFASNVYIANANQHGWFYRGPNDSSIGDIQIKTCGWGGFFQESTGNNSVGNLEIMSLHAYSCQCTHDANGAMITLANANCQFLYVDASYKNGVLFTGSASIADQILVLGNNQSNAGAYWGVIVDVACQINLIRNTDKVRTSGVDGGLLQINGTDSVIGQVRSSQSGSTTIPQTGIEINNSCIVSDAYLISYDSVGSIGVDVSATKVAINLTAKTCDTGVAYNTQGRNRLFLNFDTCVTDVNYAVAAADSDIIMTQSTKSSTSELLVRKLNGILPSLSVVDIGAAANISVNADSVTYAKVGTLGQNITIDPPTNPSLGKLLTFQFQQDGTGGRTITWDTVFKTNYSDTGNTAFKRYTIDFLYDGTFWVQRGSPSGWF